MNVSIRRILFGDGRKQSPVPLANTPDYTGGLTLLGVKNLPASIGVPALFSQELAGASGGVALIARCLNCR